MERCPHGSMATSCGIARHTTHLGLLRALRDICEELRAEDSMDEPTSSDDTVEFIGGIESSSNDAGLAGEDGSEGKCLPTAPSTVALVSGIVSAAPAVGGRQLPVDGLCLVTGASSCGLRLLTGASSCGRRGGAATAFTAGETGDPATALAVALDGDFATAGANSKQSETFSRDPGEDGVPQPPPDNAAGRLGSAKYSESMPGAST